MYLHPTHRPPDRGPAPVMDGMMREMVGIEMPVGRLEGKLVASQGEAMPDRRGALRGLCGPRAASPGAMLAAMVDWRARPDFSAAPP